MFPRCPSSQGANSGTLVDVEAGFLQQLAQLPEVLVALHRGVQLAFAIANQIRREHADVIRPGQLVLGTQHDGTIGRVAFQESLEKHSPERWIAP